MSREVHAPPHAVPLGAEALKIPGRLPSLDGLRGIAAFSVLVHHTLLTMFPPLRAVYLSTVPFEWGGIGWWMVHTPLHVLWLGAEDVYVFFVLSGIVLTLPILRSSSFNWRRYYPSRLVRLYVPVWASLAFVVVLTVVILLTAPAGGGKVFASRVPDLTPFRLIRDAALVTGVSSVDGVLWSLQWEMLFSLALPVFFVLLARTRRHVALKVAVVLVVSAVSAPFVLSHATEAGPGFYLMMFAAGVLFAANMASLRVLADAVSRRGGAGWAGLFVLACLLLCAYWFVLLASPPAALLEGSRFVSFLGALLLVFVCAFSPAAVHVLGMRVPQWLGKVSFSLYLTHAIVLETFAAFSPTPVRPLLVFLGAVVALLAAWVFQRSVEGPAHKLSQRIKRKRSDPGATVS